MPIVTVGIDRAKNVFAIYSVDEAGKVVLRKPRVMRDQLVAVVAQLPPCLIGMEVCSGAHHWARVFQQHGHTVELMATQLVAPYRMSGKRGKNDAADAAAICEAGTRTSMRFVPAKPTLPQTHQLGRLCGWIPGQAKSTKHLLTIEEFNDSPISTSFCKDFYIMTVSTSKKHQ